MFGTLTPNLLIMGGGGEYTEILKSSNGQLVSWSPRPGFLEFCLFFKFLIYPYQES